jgi:hypothetical protein
MRSHANVRIDPAIAQEVARVIQPGRQISIIDLLLDQAILNRLILSLKLGDGSLQLFILVLHMAQAGLELTDRRSAGQEARLAGTTRRKAQDCPNKRRHRGLRGTAAI